MNDFVQMKNIVKVYEKNKKEWQQKYNFTTMKFLFCNNVGNLLVI